MRFISVCVCLLPLGCATTSPPISRDSARQINGDEDYAHSSSGEVIFGPSYISQRVNGAHDIGGNIHVATDRWVLMRADELAHTQMALARLARERSASPEVQQLADRLGREQAALDDQIRAEAARQLIKLHDHYVPADTYARLSQLQGYDFDCAFLDASRELSRQQMTLWDDALDSTSEQSMAQLAFEARPRAQSSYAAIERTRL